jgi:hypothetical protein
MLMFNKNTISKFKSKERFTDIQKRDWKLNTKNLDMALTRNFSIKLVNIHQVKIHQNVENRLGGMVVVDCILNMINTDTKWILTSCANPTEK